MRLIQGAVALTERSSTLPSATSIQVSILRRALRGQKTQPRKAVEMQSAYWRKQFDTLAAQAEEVRTLSTQVAADAAKSIEGGIHKMK